MASCPSCNAEVIPGTRWCPICHANVVNPAVGQLASPGRRLGAYILDIIIANIPYLSVIISTESGDGVCLGIGIALAIGYIIWALVLYANGTTPGKSILGMRVIREDGRTAGFFTMLVRELIGKSISAIALGLGFLWILFDTDRQGWHDKLMSTYVVTRR